MNLPCYRFDFSHCQIWAANLATDGFFFFLNHCPILYESVSFKTKYLSLFLFYGGHVLSNHFWVSYTSVSSQAMSVTGCWGQVQGVGHPGDEKGAGLKSEKARETGWGWAGTGCGNNMSVGDTAEHFPRGPHSVLTETLSVRYYYPDLSLHVLGPPHLHSTGWEWTTASGEQSGPLGPWLE